MKPPTLDPHPNSLPSFPEASCMALLQQRGSLALRFASRKKIRSKDIEALGL